ncbi:ubiquinone biosynthesis protein [Pectinatus haikarae]|uniref:Ubiquinone biosynthesis protein n=2 Tax=Pectinatus haikarae TaxID=349096 RepID=A0ABT9Y809_9FIRM|nr:ubiquinone biosynthesis protein [Pectinatus haikarae]
MMLKNILTSNKYGYISSSLRLRQMLSVLRKYDAVRGMNPVRMRLILEALGPTFVKLGQVISMRPDFLPGEYIYELSKLQTRANPLPFEIIKEVIEQEYAQKWNNVFAQIDEKALGSASIAQVHHAVLKTGEKVVIKVQRPGIYEIMAQDIMLLKRTVALLQIFSKSRDVVDFTAVLDEMWTITKQEMDFMMEADHIDEFRHLNSDDSNVECPQVYRKLTTARILVMEYVDGIRIDEIDKLKQAGYDVEALGRNLGKNYIKQIIKDGYFHADPHSGNVWVRGGKIIWLDLGMMGRLSQQERNALKKAIYALVHNDTFAMKSAILSLGVPKGKIDHIKLYEDIDILMLRYSDLRFEELNLGRLSHDIIAVLRRHNMGIIPGLSMFARGIMTIDGIMQITCPDINFVDILKDQMQSEFSKNFNWRNELKKMRQEGYSLIYRSMQLPEQLSDMIKMTMSGQTKVNLDLTGSEEPLKRIDKMINKLIIGIISAALLLGSSIICTTNMTPKFLEIPFLGILGYLSALLLCARLLISIWRHR